MKNLFASFVVIVALISLVPTEAAAQHRVVTAADPANAELERYPIEKGPLSAARMAELGLRPEKLADRWVGLNHHREVEGGRWVFETLPAGTLVLVDAMGTPWYLAECGNRLLRAATNYTDVVIGPEPMPLPEVAPERNWLERLGDAFRDGANWLWAGIGRAARGIGGFLADLFRAIGWLLLLLLPLLIAFAIGYWLANRRRGSRGGGAPANPQPHSPSSGDHPPASPAGPLNQGVGPQTPAGGERVPPGTFYGRGGRGGAPSSGGRFLNIWHDEEEGHYTIDPGGFRHVSMAERNGRFTVRVWV